MDPYRLFDSFPTQNLTPQTLITLAAGLDPQMAQGMMRLQAAAPLPALLLNDEEVAALVIYLTPDAKPAGDIAALFEPRRRNACWLTLGWLAKTGLVRWA
jgi:hypothetical protein